MKAVFCALNKIVKTGISCHSKISDVAESGESWEHCYIVWCRNSGSKRLTFLIKS